MLAYFPSSSSPPFIGPFVAMGAVAPSSTSPLSGLSVDPLIEWSSCWSEKEGEAPAIRSRFSSRCCRLDRGVMLAILLFEPRLWGTAGRRTWIASSLSAAASSAPSVFFLRRGEPLRPASGGNDFDLARAAPSPAGWGELRTALSRVTVFTARLSFCSGDVGSSLQVEEGLGATGGCDDGRGEDKDGKECVVHGVIMGRIWCGRVGPGLAGGCVLLTALAQLVLKPNSTHRARRCLRFGSDFSFRSRVGRAFLGATDCVEERRRRRVRLQRF